MRCGCFRKVPTPCGDAPAQPRPNKRLAFAVANVTDYAQKLTNLTSNRRNAHAQQADPPSDKKEPVVIKKYANRRLYNTETSTYVTLDDLAAMVKGERYFVVFDAKTGDDLTHAVLTQIIVDEESQKRGETLLPIPFLRQLIFVSTVPASSASCRSYLGGQRVAGERAGAVPQAVRRRLHAAGAFEAYQETARKNLAMFEQAMLMFSPFGHNKNLVAKPGEEPKNRKWSRAASPRRSPSSRRSSPPSSRSSRAPTTTSSRRIGPSSHPASAARVSRQGGALSLLDLLAPLRGNHVARAQLPAPIVRSRATRMPIVKPATTSISAPTMTKKNTRWPPASTTRNSMMVQNEHQHREPVVEQRRRRSVGRLDEPTKRKIMVMRMIRSPRERPLRTLDHRSP